MKFKKCLDSFSLYFSGLKAYIIGLVMNSICCQKDKADQERAVLTLFLSSIDIDFNQRLAS